MNLSVAELAELPLAAALVDTEDTVIGHTPEWRGAGPGTVAHPVRRMRLLVATAEVPATCHALLDRLLEAIEQAAGEAAETAALRLRMLAAALRVLAGRRAGAAGSSADVLRFAATGIAARTGLEVVERAGPSFSLRGFEAAALVLVQLAVNAERHEGATAATLSNDRSAFHVSWSGDSAEPRVTAARRRAHRERWGLSFARIAADTLGGAITAPYGSAPGTTTVSFELGLGRLALPLAALRGRRVLKATRAWDEETGTPPGTEAREGTRLALLRTAALRSLRSIVQVDGWTARSGESQTLQGEKAI